MKPPSPQKTWLNPCRIALSSAAIVVLAGCQLAGIAKHDKPKADGENEELYSEPKGTALTPEAKEVNDVARLLAGLPAMSEADTNKKWRSEDFWRAHKTGMAKIWKEFGAKRGTKVRKWAATEVADVAGTPVVFQPFGGPDFVFSHLLFPNADTYVVCGKAPCLDMPKFENITADVMADTVYSLREASAAILKVDREPEPQKPAPSGKSMQGALPLLLALAARTGHVVEGVELMPNDDSAPAPGQIPLDPSSAAGPSSKHAHPTSACMITMRAGDGVQRRLFYFQQDLSDEGLPESAALLQYLNKQNRVVVVVNESSHELHQNNTNRIQQYIAKHAVALIQDPSGVPFRHFSPDAWNVQKYGSYSGAPSEFRNYDQPELIFAFNDKNSKPQPLPFGAGPLNKEMPTALMIARPLITNASDLPVNVEVTPLSEPAATDSPVASAPTGTPVADQSTTTPVSSGAPSSAPPAVASPEPAATSALEASLGAAPLAPLDLTPPK